MADNVNRLLIVDEDGAVADFVGRIAKRVGYAVASAASGASFVHLRPTWCSWAAVTNACSRRRTSSA
jgi:hypothetical protein